MDRTGYARGTLAVRGPFGRGCLAGPLVAAAVLFDYERLRDHAVRPLALLNDSKQVVPADREERIDWLFHWWERIDDWIETNRVDPV